MIAPSPLGPNTRVRQNPRVACRVYDGLAEVVTLDSPIRQHRLNPVATQIWQHAADARTLDELTDAVVREFAVEREVARADVEAFCREMIERGLLESIAG